MATFGRRATSVQPHAHMRAASPPTAPAERTITFESPVGPVTSAPPMEEPLVSVEEELRRWKAQRGYKIPWRQLSFMASLCFGIASFELPDSVNSEVDWLLYGLAAISLYVGVSGWIKKTSDAAAARDPGL